MLSDYDIKRIIKEDFEGFIKLVNLNIFPLEKAEDAVIATKNARYTYLFVQNVEGANVIKLEDALIKTKNKEKLSCLINCNT